jgi:hypothetical protein
VSVVRLWTLMYFLRDRHQIISELRHHRCPELAGDCETECMREAPTVVIRLDQVKADEGRQ